MSIQKKYPETEFKGIVEESSINYNLAEEDLLIKALQRTHMERFLFATKLYKIQKTMQRAIVTHQPNIKK